MRPARTALLALAAGTIVTLAGCQGHGVYTTEALDAAEARMSSIQAATRWDLAHQQFLSGDLEKALGNVKTSIELHDEVAQSHVLHGRILLEMGQLKAALDAFNTAIEHDEETADPFYYRGIVFERFGQFADAYESYESAAEREASDPQFAIAAAEMLIQLDRLDDAEDALVSRESEFQHSAGVKQTLGHIALLQDEPRKAVSLFREARLLASDDLSITEDLITAEMRAEYWVEAEFNARTLLETDEFEDRRDITQLRARCLAELGRPVDSRQLLLDLTTRPGGASDASVWLDLGKVCVELGDERRVRQCASKFSALAPARHEGYMLSAALDMRAGQYESALAALQLAAERTVTDARPAMLLGVVYQQLGRHDEAATSFAEALKINPQDPRAQRMLASMPLDD